MAQYAQNYDFLLLTSTGGLSGNTGIYNQSNGFGNGYSAATINSIYCISAGTITVNSLVSSSVATFAMAAGNRLDLMIGACTVSSGAFLGIKAQLEWFPGYNGNM